MQTSLSFLTDDQKPKPEIIPYSKEAMRQDLDRVRHAWGDCQCRRQRDAIYGYLTAVYDLVTWWAAEQRDVERARRALCSRRLDVPEREDPSLPSSGAPPTRPEWTSAPGASGRGLCGTRPRSRIRTNPFSRSWCERAASTSALLDTRDFLDGRRKPPPPPSADNN